MAPGHSTKFVPVLRLSPHTLLAHRIVDGKQFVRCITITDAREGWWARPVGCVVRLFFSRNEWRYLIANGARVACKRSIGLDIQDL